MEKIDNPKYFPTTFRLAIFSGKNYADALQKAIAWAKQTGVIITHYFEQKTFGNSILVSYENPR